MGFGLGAAIGACVASSDPTVLITGDGSFGMNLNELATAVSYNIPVIIVVFNNGVLGMVRQWQTLFFGKRYSNTILDRKTDFIKLAEAFGAVGIRADSPESFRKAFKDALAAGGPVVIDALIDKDEFTKDPIDAYENKIYCKGAPLKTGVICKENGADVLVAGSAFFGAADRAAFAKEIEL